jgi:DNA-directed RNA polymerase specialized sigma24 family protein
MTDDETEVAALSSAGDRVESGQQASTPLFHGSKYLTPAQVAEMLQVSEKTVWRRWDRAGLRLRESLGDRSSPVDDAPG